MIPPGFRIKKSYFSDFEILPKELNAVGQGWECTLVCAQKKKIPDFSNKPFLRPKFAQESILILCRVIKTLFVCKNTKLFFGDNLVPIGNKFQ